LEAASLKVTTGAAAGSVLTSDATGNATWKAKLANIIYVAKIGGDFQKIVDALASITDATVTNPYLIRVAPGVYTEQVTMKEFVSIEGAGEGTTIIKYTGSANYPSATDSSSATVIGASNAELRSLTVQSDGTGKNYGTAIYNKGNSPTLSHLTITASGGATNRGVYNDTSSSPPMNNLTITASGGIESDGVSNNNNSSPAMNNLTITASGGTNNFGVSNDTSSPAMNNLTITASGGTNNFGVYNAISSPAMNNLTITASGGTITTGENYGVSNNNNSSPPMNNLTITASGGTYTYGVYNDINSSPTIYSSRIKGGTNSVFNNNSTAKIANTMLNGAVSTGCTCINAYDASFTTLPANCIIAN